MHRLTLSITLALTLLSSAVFAQNTSTIQMQLVASPAFTTRLQYLGWQVAQEVLVEPATAIASGVIPAYTAVCHTKRVNYALYFLSSPPRAAGETAVGISGVNVAGAVIIGSVTGSGPTADSSATDGALQQAYRVLWNTFSGCATNP